MRKYIVMSLVVVIAFSTGALAGKYFSDRQNKSQADALQVTKDLHLAVACSQGLKCLEEGEVEKAQKVLCVYLAASIETASELADPKLRQPVETPNIEDAIAYAKEYSNRHAMPETEKGADKLLKTMFR